MQGVSVGARGPGRGPDGQLVLGALLPRARHHGGRHHGRKHQVVDISNYLLYLYLHYLPQPARGRQLLHLLPGDWAGQARAPGHLRGPGAQRGGRDQDRGLQGALPPRAGAGETGLKKLHPNFIRRFVITEKAPTRAFSWLKAPTSNFTFKTLLRHAKRALTPR